MNEINKLKYEIEKLLDTASREIIALTPKVEDMKAQYNQALTEEQERLQNMYSQQTELNNLVSIVHFTISFFQTKISFHIF